MTLENVCQMNAMGDPNSLWVVRGSHGSHCPQVPVVVAVVVDNTNDSNNDGHNNNNSNNNKNMDYELVHGADWMQGTAVKNGQAVRLTHLKTQRNLHTAHILKSPLHGDF